MDIEQLNETCCRIGNINDGDKIPIGGSFFGKFDLSLTADPNSFSLFFTKVKGNAENIKNNQNIRRWLQNINPDFDFSLFAEMLAFDNVLRKMYPAFTDNEKQRKNFYTPEQSPALSAAFAEGVCQCAETAVLAQLYFQHRDTDTRYFGGELLRSPTDEQGEAHSFITFVRNDKHYTYDPANPHPTNNNGLILPRIGQINASPTELRLFAEKIKNGNRRCAFLESKDIISGQSWYYGVGDGCNIFPEFIIHRQSSLPSSQNTR